MKSLESFWLAWFLNTFTATSSLYRNIILVSNPPTSKIFTNTKISNENEVVKIFMTTISQCNHRFFHGIIRQKEVYQSTWGFLLGW